MQASTWCALAVLCSCGSSSPSTPDAVAGDASSDAAPDAAAPARLLAYVGGYGPDISRYDVENDGGFDVAGTTPAFAPGPSFLAITPRVLYAVSESNSQVGAYAISATGGLSLINQASAGGNGPAHVSVDGSGRYALVANYGDGSVATLAIRDDGGVGAPRTYAVCQNAHMIITDPSNRYAFVPCLGSSFVAQFTFDAATGELAPNDVPHLDTAAGAGPRHLAFAPDGKHVYLLNELDSTLSALTFDATTGRLSEIQTLSTRAAGATGTNSGAEVEVHPSGAFVYASNRGDNTIAVFAVEADGKVRLVGQAPTLGRTPRHFIIDPTGTRLYVANQASNNVVPFAIDLQTGMPAPIAQLVTVASPTFVGFFALPSSSR